MTTSSLSFRVPTLGIETRAWQYGDPTGAPMLLVHGFRGDHHGLEPLAAQLAQRLPGIRAIVPDLPGFGKTPAIPGREHNLALYGEWLRSFADQVTDNAADDPADDPADRHDSAGPFGQHRFAVLGHSFGSLIVSAAIDGGMSPSRLILVNPISAPALEGPQAALTWLATAYYRTAERLPERAARRLLGNPAIVRGMSEVMAKTGDPGLRAWIHGQHDAYFSSFSDPTTLLQAFRASVSHTVPDFSHAFTMPTLLIAGDRDDITPLVKQLELQHRVPASRLRIIPGTGHLVHYEAVEDAVAFTAEFLRSTQAEASLATLPNASGGAGA